MSIAPEMAEDNKLVLMLISIVIRNLCPESKTHNKLFSIVYPAFCFVSSFAPLSLPTLPDEKDCLVPASGFDIGNVVLVDNTS